ncbi:MAG: hypothetical protein JO171_05360 [Paludibacterium sp.]|uniref:hypothetical protein n=1 Tax=Paludibacterium sp. TaxID=1917523 RepID=UPI0026001E21|nr:hypothetical protein [Paludibacterium sp.]MBV8046556.1 hypothetical protein [Paludibacterium sp.]MBV8648251.1 hypothetical protein [Paludibacterium sp.]
MAISHRTAIPTAASNRDLRQLPLFALISELCAPRAGQADPGICRLIVDSRLPWASLRVDSERSWLYFPEVVRTRRVAGCVILTAE